MADNIRITLDLNDAAVQKALKTTISNADLADAAFKKLKQSGPSTFEEISVGIGKATGVWEIFEGNLLANLAVKSFEFMAEAAHKAFEVLIVEGVKAASEAETSTHALNVALGQAGQYSKKASADFLEFASAMERTTTVQDDEIVKNAALIESMTNLSEGGLKRATKAALDLSAAFGIDLQTASQAVAKAHEGNVTALHKMGLEIESTGSHANTFENTLQVIESRLGGSAQEKANTYSGRIAQMANQFNNLQEEMGNVIIQNPVIIAAIQKVSDIIVNMTESMKGANGNVSRLVGEGFLRLIEVSKSVVGAFGLILDVAKIAFAALNGAFLTAEKAFLSFMGLFSDEYKGLLDVVKQETEEAARDLNKSLNSSSLSAVSNALDEVGDAAEKGFKKLSTGAEDSGVHIRNLKSSHAALTEEQIRAQGEIDNWVKSQAAAFESVKDQYNGQMEALKAHYEEKLGLIQSNEHNDLQLRIDAENDYNTQQKAVLAQRLQNELDTINKSKLSNETKVKALLETTRKYNAEATKLDADRVKAQGQFDKEREQNTKDSLSIIAGMSSSSNRTLASIGKAAGLVQIAIDTPVAISKALASAPPPFNFVLAAGVGIAMAEQAAKLTGVKFAEGGIVPGTNFIGDRVPALMNSGEMVLNQSQQSTLFNKIKSGDFGGGDSSGPAILSKLNDIYNALSAGQVIKIGEREIFDVIRDGLRGGRTLTV